MSKKRKWIIVAGALALALVLTACGAVLAANLPGATGTASVPDASTPGEAGTPAESGEEEMFVYRGAVEEIMEDGSIRVVQLDGYNYGHDSIVFHMGEDTVLTDSNAELVEDAFVEVTYGGILTKSLPPQGTAKSVTVLSPRSEGIVQNGVVKEVEQDENGDYRITILPFGVTEDTFENQVILLVPQDALEGIEAAEPVEGLEVSAVTRGIATASLPPQVPVIVLLPYSGA